MSRSKHYESEYLVQLQEHAARTRELLSNSQKSARERMVVRAFLRCAGISFAETEIKPGTTEPTDVSFRCARFQIRDIVGGRKRGQEWIERERKYAEAMRVGDVMERWVRPTPVSIPEMSRMVAQQLAKKASKYGNSGCAGLDALIYIDVSRYLWPLDGEPASDAIEALDRHGWRSVSVLFVPYATVLTAKSDAPGFLLERAGLIISQWPEVDRVFEE